MVVLIQTHWFLAKGMVDIQNLQVLKWMKMLMIHAAVRKGMITKVNEMVDNRNFPTLIHATLRKGPNKVDEMVDNRNFQVLERKGVALCLILIQPRLKLVLGMKKGPI